MIKHGLSLLCLVIGQHSNSTYSFGKNGNQQQWESSDVQYNESEKEQNMHGFPL